MKRIYRSDLEEIYREKNWFQFEILFLNKYVYLLFFASLNEEINDEKSVSTHIRDKIKSWN